MSIPRNHHYVSQVHLKQFFNEQENLIYVYDKQRENYFSKKTTKSLFSEKDLNTRYIDENKDFESLENDLNNFFEKDFNENLNIVNKLVESSDMTQKANNALYYFAKYGVVGDLRTPRHKKAMDDTIWESMSKLIPMCTPELKEELEEMFAYRKEVKYSNVLEYSEISEKILKLMGGLIFKIIIPKNESDFFVVPDCSSITMRDKINEYFNPDIKEIAYIGIPISSKMYIHFFSEKLFKDNKPISDVVYEDTCVIDKINKASFDVCQSKIACENELYLKKFIRKIKIVTQNQL